MSPGNPFILASNGQRSKVKVMRHKKVYIGLQTECIIDACCVCNLRWVFPTTMTQPPVFPCVFFAVSQPLPVWMTALLWVLAASGRFCCCSGTYNGDVDSDRRLHHRHLCHRPHGAPAAGDAQPPSAGDDRRDRELDSVSGTSRSSADGRRKRAGPRALHGRRRFAPGGGGTAPGRGRRESDASADGGHVKTVLWDVVR